MGMIRQALQAGRTVGAVGDAVEGVSEVFVENATRRMELTAEARAAALRAASAEFEHAGVGRFDRAINGLNRLPRPLLALGTMGLFVYAMADPLGFSARMRGLSEVPDPLWWLLGAIVSFYFGARELHYFRGPLGPGSVRAGRGASGPQDGASDNAALSAWRAEDG
ncbi:Methionine synthase I, cobalamin-binding protein domain protein [Roseibacterium elongatum DSM 19469]|uniref:Methionine synthase I, cobalamin-binding protein domain protein n=1 Tax=Roseicyclus elongatus DSM 19469 TaxID=1294273 RepID=W8S4Q5_9RHOB|nr:holin family protein [Roseibacterium elongatum]AHM05202.1 Methionine synthase I, cobalamin-binding protein domain protein [Roseibacterium elongatum DSM 19469]